MKGAGTLLLTLILSGFCGPRCGAAVYHSNGTPQSVQFIHNHQAQNGDTITLPAGRFSWTSKVSLTKAIILKGQTIRNDDGTSIDNTIIQDNIPRSTNDGLIELLAPGGQRVTGITFVQGLTQVQGNGIIRVQGTTPTRIDHCVFDHVYFSPMINVGDYNYGVIDHNTKRNPISNEGLVHFRMGGQSGKHGDEPWMLPAGYGGPDFFFVEDNLMYGGMDLTLGSKVVVRHNKFVYANMSSHGTGKTLQNGRAARAVEIYNNEFRLNGQALTGSNGGGVVVHDNRIVPLNGGVKGIPLGNYRTIYNFGAPFFGANGASRWDYNATEPNGSHVNGHPPYLFASGTLSSVSNGDPYTVTDSTKNWSWNRWRGYSIRRPSDGATAVIRSNTNHTLRIVQWRSQSFAVGDKYEIRKVIQVLDQPGLGAQVGTMNRNNPRWMQQATEPCYSWNNTDQNNNPVNFKQLSSGKSILVGRDYFNNTPMPGYTPYTYPHPLVSGASVPTDFNGDAKPDYLLYNPTTLQTVIWYLNNNVLSGQALGPTLWPGWNVAGVADFNLDGHPDYLLFAPSAGQTAIWYLNNSVRIGSAWGPTVWPGWNVAGVADFNLDDQPDYLLFRPDTGQTAIWYLNNSVRNGHSFGPTLWPGWNVAGVADFNLDDQPDYLLFRPDTGQTAIWYLNNSVRIGSAWGPAPWAGWHLVAP